MSEMDDLIAGFKNSMQIAGLIAGGDANTDVPTPAGNIPSLAKQSRLAQERINAVLGDGSKVIRTDDMITYTEAQRNQARLNIGLNNVDNTPDAKKPMSEPVQLVVNDLLKQIQASEQQVNRNAPNGYPGLDNARLVLPSTTAAGLSYLSNTSPTPRNWTLPSKDGTLATLADITGTNSGTNTGDETTATIKAKLGISVLSGSNTGDFDSVMTYASLANFPNQGVDKRVYIAADGPTMYYWNGTTYKQLNALVTSSDSVPEGQTNLYFTQLRSIQSLLSTYVVGANGAVTTSDTVVSAISKLQTQINNAINDYTAKLNLRESLANKATDFSVINHTVYPTVQAVKTYADALVAGVLKDCGNWDASSNAFPTTGGSGTTGAIKKGNLWYVSVAGTLGGLAVNVGDAFRALVDTPGQTASNWAVLESNLGYVPYNASNPAGYISGITGSMVNTALGYMPLKPADKNTSNGLVGLNGYKHVLVNNLGTVTSTIGTDATAPRTWNFPDKDGTLATLADLAGTSSGSNTGDETQASILQKLGATQVTGSNTGDQTITLTGDVTGTGTSSFAATIAPNAVTLAKMTKITGGQILGRATAGIGNVETLTGDQVKTILALDQVSNTSDANKPISTAQQTALNLKENSANKAIDFSVVDNVKFPTTLAVKTLLDARLTNIVVDCGNWDASVGTYPNTGGTGANGAIKKGNLFFVSVAGTIGGMAVNVGDSIRALVDAPGQTAANWDVLESNLGYVPYNASNPAGYISAITGTMVTNALGYTPVSAATKDASGGVVGLTGYKHNLKNNAGTFTSTLENAATAARAYVLPDKSGTVALTSDITGTNSGTNTGDETGATIRSKLGISSLSGSNTGDETKTSILSKIGVTTLSGDNTGDETAASIKAKLGYTPVNQAGDSMTGPLNWAPFASVTAAGYMSLGEVTSNVVEVTGTNDIVSLGLSNGQMRFVTFSGTPMLRNSADLVLPTGQDISVQKSDCAVFVGRPNGTAQCLHYLPANGMPIFGNMRERVLDIVANGPNTNIDLLDTKGPTVFRVTLSANTSFSFDIFHALPANQILNFKMILINDSVGGRAVSFANPIKWPGGNVPARTTAANAVDVWSFFFDGTDMFGTLSAKDLR